MKTHLKTLALGATIVGALAAAPALYAQSYLSMSHGSMMGEGMMGDSGIMGMMGGMMNMMGMSGDMGDMMEQCGQMMQAMDDGNTRRPNDQWRSPDLEEPAQPRE
jgi:membrane protease subunit (stomatin/prohibitin family)